MSRNMRSAAARFSERISDSSRSSSSMRCGSTPSATSRSPFTRKGSFVVLASGSSEATPFTFAWRASVRISAASTLFGTEPVRKIRLAAERPCTPVMRDEESVVAANVPPTAMRSATTFVKMVASPPFLSTA
jgi:hypothetical protein